MQSYVESLQFTHTIFFLRLKYYFCQQNASQVDEDDKIAALLDWMPQQDDPTFIVFCRALREDDQDDVVNLLMRGLEATDVQEFQTICMHFNSCNIFPFNRYLCIYVCMGVGACVCVGVWVCVGVCDPFVI